MLREIPNLIFITSNRFVPGWAGDYKRERPANIAITEQYSELFAKSLPNATVIDLTEWSHESVRLMTCDNLHLTRQGSDYIYDRIMTALNISPSDGTCAGLIAGLARGFTGIRHLETITASKKKSLLDAAKRPRHLATLIIGLRLDSADSSRFTNLQFLLAWITQYYDDLFDVLLVEQDSVQRVDLAQLAAGPNVRYEFIYNPNDYNRGWGYNVAVRHFCENAEVVALMDTDVLTGANFVREIIDCHSKYDAISPYQNIYYTDEAEAQGVRAKRRCDWLKDVTHIKNPVTVAGGILIIRRNVYLALKGFEQYVGYGCEDRALDVTMFNHIDPARVRIASETYVHLHHPSDAGARARFKEIYAHLVTQYRCQYTPGLGPFDFIHRECQHAPRAVTLRLMLERAESFGDKNLYRHADAPSVNGIVRTRHATATHTANVIYPPDFTSLDEYERKERYDDAPAPDSDELASFYNAYKGKRCFIIGNGPSLNKNDLSLLENEYSFGVNSFYYKTRETGFRPFFYVVEDSSVMKENIAEIRQFDAPFKFFPTNYKRMHPKQPNTFFFRMNRGFYEKSSPNFVVPRFSTDASKVLYCGQSVTYINLQLAYYMGFSEVYLIGMDFSYVIPESHQRTGDVLLSDTDDENHFHKDYFGKGKTWKDPKLDRVALNYRQAKLVYEATGRRIFNATIGGNLEVFDRVDYNGLFGTPCPNRSMVPPSVPVEQPRDAVDYDELGSIRDANQLFTEGKYGQCATMCDALFSARGLGMYGRLAEQARARLKDGR